MISKMTRVLSILLLYQPHRELKDLKDLGLITLCTLNTGEHSWELKSMNTGVYLYWYVSRAI